MKWTTKPRMRNTLLNTLRNCLAPPNTQHTQELLYWSNLLRETNHPHSVLHTLFELLSKHTHPSTRIVMGYETPTYPPNTCLTSTQHQGFQHCLEENKAMGQGTARYETLNDLYLPFRGKTNAFGVCLLINAHNTHHTPHWVQHAQALCDQMGQACEQHANTLKAQQATELANLQKTRSVFLAAIAHDQRTPLASIMTCASTLIEKSQHLSHAEVTHYAQLIYSESQQIARLTENTLTLARLSGEGIHIPKQLESAEDIVSTVLQRRRQRTNPHHPQVKVTRGIPLIPCNIMMIEQTLDNLIENAIKHSGTPDHIQLHVKHNQHHVLFTIQDQGIGIATNPLNSDQVRGLGIGLQLCQAVAQAHQGQLSIHSQPGLGTKATLAIPLHGTAHHAHTHSID